MRPSSSNKVSKDLEKLLFINTMDAFDTFIPKLKDVYLITYSDELLNISIDENSLANPVYFYEDYMEALDDFEYISVVAKGEIKITVPDEDTFTFEGRLTFLQWLSMGVIGTYYELSKNDYDYLINYDRLSKQIRSTLKDLPGFLGEEFSDLDFYILDDALHIHEILEHILKKKLVLFPFSNTQAIDLFIDGRDFFNTNKEALTNNIVEKSLKDLKRRAY